MKLTIDEKLEKFATSIQQRLDGCPALLIGSGGSIPYGLPSMKDLATEIVNQLETKYQEEDSWKAFVAELNNTNNLELALDNIMLKDEIHTSIIATVWSCISKKDREAFLDFIRHGKYPALTMIIKKFIQRAGVTNIITTNYDRLVEYSIDFAQGAVETGFSGNYIKNFGNIQSTFVKRTVNLYKVHGSVDWFKHKSNQNILATQFLDYADFSDIYLPMIVTPGNGKYKETHKDPFRTVIAEADKALRSSTSYLCIGYGFNDEHIQPIIIDENRNKNKPLVIVTKELTPKIKDLFIQADNSNCLIISELSGGGTIVHYSKSETEAFPEDYWRLDLFYRLWLE
ncbi:hypothetical protein Psch_02633 [Pelotomaculum schinkii]|uniref:Uncharacterized protein n=1 Tax=Pelotomaculum schinkii TaxID=78350 RepID=A0A4Y7R9Y6_9FIRM|nr:SIR2 family protein [Pelotomaculum schinkii]TEB05592.1 hypothetical protein Psch_02633 [Pelotomaculum schinkii]